MWRNGLRDEWKTISTDKVLPRGYHLERDAGGEIGSEISRA